MCCKSGIEVLVGWCCVQTPASLIQMATLRTSDHRAVRWYLRYSLLYRDVEEPVTERGLSADHTTIWHSTPVRTGTQPEVPARTKTHQRVLEGG